MAITEHEFEQAEQRVRSLREHGYAVAVRYNRRRSRVVVSLNTGVKVAFQAGLAEGLASASPEDLADIEISPPASACTGRSWTWRCTCRHFCKACLA